MDTLVGVGGNISVRSVEGGDRSSERVGKAHHCKDPRPEYLGGVSKTVGTRTKTPRRVLYRPGSVDLTGTQGCTVDE